MSRTKSTHQSACAWWGLCEKIGTRSLL